MIRSNFTQILGVYMDHRRS